MYKQYQLINYTDMTLRLIVGGVQKAVDFTGGSQFPILVRGKFATTDPKIMEALEGHPLFNVDYRLIKEEKPVHKPVAPQSKAKEISGISSVQAARDWLVENLQLEEASLNNKARILMAAENNNIIFTDLK